MGIMGIWESEVCGFIGGEQALLIYGIFMSVRVYVWRRWVCFLVLWFGAVSEVLDCEEVANHHV